MTELEKMMKVEYMLASFDVAEESLGVGAVSVEYV